MANRAVPPPKRARCLRPLGLVALALSLWATQAFGILGVPEPAQADSRLDFPVWVRVTQSESRASISSGSLVDDRWVLVAQHGVSGRSQGPRPTPHDARVWLGVTRPAVPMSSPQSPPIDAIIYHPTLDIAMLHLRASAHKTPVALKELDFSPTSLRLVGRGLIFAPGSVTSYANSLSGDVQFSYANSMLWGDFPFVKKTADTIVFGHYSQDYPISTAGGDSGGPVVVWDGVGWSQVGVLSSGNEYKKVGTSPDESFLYKMNEGGSANAVAITPELRTWIDKTKGGALTGSSFHMEFYLGQGETRVIPLELTDEQIAEMKIRSDDFLPYADLCENGVPWVFAGQYSGGPMNWEVGFGWCRQAPGKSYTVVVKGERGTESGTVFIDFPDMVLSNYPTDDSPPLTKNTKGSVSPPRPWSGVVDTAGLPPGEPAMATVRLGVDGIRPEEGPTFTITSDRVLMVQVSDSGTRSVLDDLGMQGGWHLYSKTLSAGYRDELVIEMTGDITAGVINSTVTVSVPKVAPEFSTGPMDTTVADGGDAVFSVVTSGIPQPLVRWWYCPTGTLQWKNLEDGGNIDGATSTTLVWKKVDPTMNGARFRCLAENRVLPLATSAEAVLVVTQAALTVTGIAPASGTTAGGTSVTITGTNFTGATSVTIGGSAATGVVVVSDTSITAVTPAGAAGTKDVVVTTPGGIGTGVGLFAYGAHPVLTAAPAGATIASGATATLTVGAAGTAPLSYQWYRGDSGGTASPIPGATTPSFTTPALTAWARYWVRVSNPYGTADSATTLVEVNGGTVTIADWAAQGEGTPDGTLTAAQRGPLATPAGDGVTNLMKFLLGVPPMENAESRLPVPVRVIVPGVPVALALDCTVNPHAQGIRYALEMSDNMVTWTEAASITEPRGTNPDGTQLVRLREAAAPVAPRHFVRLKVTMVSP